jgi:ParB family chromosome partitioning protein
MNQTDINRIRVSEIRIVNPRSRNKTAWLSIVNSIKAVGLKKPITVSRRKAPDSEAHTFDLVCGQGRLEAFIALGETHIPAIISDAPTDDQHLMSLVENIARRPPSNRGIYFEVRRLRETGYKPLAIAKKLGLNNTYIYGIFRLVENGESQLISAVESGRLPISVAIEISNGDGEKVQRALTEGYERGEFRGKKLSAIRRIVEQRAARIKGTDSAASNEPRLSGIALVNLYKSRVKEQQRLVVKADQTKERMLMIVSAMKLLLKDEHLVTLLRAETLLDIPEQLAVRIQ